MIGLKSCQTCKQMNAIDNHPALTVTSNLPLLSFLTSFGVQSQCAVMKQFDRQKNKDQ
jgi:hypothetical protein